MVSRWALVFPMVVHTATVLLFVSGLLNVTRHIEGRWVQFAGEGKDLDRLETYQELDLGLFADPAELRYGVVLGEVRPQEPDRLFDLRVMGPAGPVQEETMKLRATVPVDELTLFQWAVGPGVRITLLHEKDGRLLDRPLVLWPSAIRPGTFEETLATDELELQVRVSRWPPAGEEAPEVEVALRKRDAEGVRDLLTERLVEPRSVNKGAEGYAVIVWEIRPYLGLGLVRGTYRQVTLVALAGILLGLLGWAIFRPRVFRYEELEGGGLRVWPESAGARLTRGKRA